MIRSIIRYFKYQPTPDPVKHCKVYKTVGCNHVDGFLCDVRTCNITVELKVSSNSIDEMKPYRDVVGK